MNHLSIVYSRNNCHQFSKKVVKHIRKAEKQIIQLSYKIQHIYSTKKREKKNISITADVMMNEISTPLVVYIDIE